MVVKGVELGCLPRPLTWDRYVIARLDRGLGMYYCHLKNTWGVWCCRVFNLDIPGNLSKVMTGLRLA